MKNIFIVLTVATIFNACTKPTEACFTFSPTTVSPNTTVTFNASCTQNGYSFTWNFGDNSQDTTTHEPTITHKFSTTGQFTVTLNADRKDGVTLRKGKPTTTQTVTVQ
jgi:PKD repeat protein